MSTPRNGQALEPSGSALRDTGHFPSLAHLTAETPRRAPLAILAIWAAQGAVNLRRKGQCVRVDKPDPLAEKFTHQAREHSMTGCVISQPKDRTHQSVYYSPASS